MHVQQVATYVLSRNHKRAYHFSLNTAMTQSALGAAGAELSVLGPLRVQTVCGSGRIGSSDGPSETATFSFPHSVLPLPDGSALVSDSGNDAVRHISIDHSGSGRFMVRRVGSRGFTWLRPRGMAQMADGGVLVCDSGHNRVRLLGADGSVSVFAGSGRKGMADGPAHAASFNAPSGLCVCADGTVLVADTGNHAIRVVAPTATARVGGAPQRVVSTLAGCGREGHGDGPAGAAKFDKPAAVLALGPPSGLAGGESVVYVADAGNHCLRIISNGPSGIGGKENSGDGNGRRKSSVGAASSAAGGSAAAGELIVGTLCGKPGVSGCANGKFGEVLMGSPTGLAVLPDGTLAVSEASSNMVRRVHVEAQRVSPLAGCADRAYGLVDGPSDEARFNCPKGIAVSSAGGEVWLADAQNHCVRLLREDDAARMSEAAAHAAEKARARPIVLSLPAPQSAASWEIDGAGAALETHDRSSVVAIDQAVAAAVGRPSPLRPTGSPRAATWADAGSAADGHGHGGALVAAEDGSAHCSSSVSSVTGSPMAYQTNRQPLAQTAAAKTALTSSLGELPPTESFSTEGFRAEAQLFEREVPKTRSGEARGGWTYSGAATVSLVRCAPRAARLTVQVHGAAAAEVSVLRPSQMRLRDTAFVVCGHDPSSSASGYAGFGPNELGLRFRTTTAAASLLAACEAIVGEAAGGGGGGAASAEGVAAAPPPPPRPTTGEAFMRVASAPASPNHHRARDGSYAHSTCESTEGSAHEPPPLPSSKQHVAAMSSSVPASPAGSRMSGAHGAAAGRSSLPAPATASSARRAAPSGIPTLRRPRPNAPAAAGGQSGEGGGGDLDARLQLAEQDVLRLSARLAEREMEATRLLKRLEQAQAQVRSRDAKVAELTRRLALLGKPPSPMKAFS